MTELQIQFIGWALILLINIIGWWRADKNTKKATAKAEEIAKETAAQEIQRIEHTLRDLPCEKDGDYQMKQGKLIQKVNDMDDTLKRIETKMDAISRENIRRV